MGAVRLKLSARNEGTQRMWNYVKLALLAVIALLAAYAANFGRDLAYQVHAIIIMLVAGGLLVWTIRNTDEPAKAADTGYMDGVIRYGVVATAFWGAVGFLVGVVIAFQLAFPALNFEVLQGYGNFGRQVETAVSICCIP